MTNLAIITNYSKRINWTIEMDNTIIKCISECPSNISMACEESAKLLNLPLTTITGRYYNHLRTKTNIIALGSKDTMMVNTKNTARKNNEENFHFELVQSLIIKLTKDQKKFIVKSLLGL